MQSYKNLFFLFLLFNKFSYTSAHPSKIHPTDEATYNSSNSSQKYFSQNLIDLQLHHDNLKLALQLGYKLPTDKVTSEKTVTCFSWLLTKKK